MRVKLSDLSVLAYANNFTLWHYKTKDQTVRSDGYFNAGTDMMRVNDLLICNVDTDGEAKTEFLTVTGNAGGVVTVAQH